MTKKVESRMLLRYWRHGLLKTVTLIFLCLLLGLIDGFRSYFNASYDGTFFLELKFSLYWSVTGWLIWTALIPLVLKLARRFPLDQNNWHRRLPLLACAGLLFAMVRTFFPPFVIILIPSGSNKFLAWFARTFYYSITDFAIAFVFYALVLAFGQAINYYKRYREEELRAVRLESQLSLAQLNALKMQLHPHFLFNALNSISALQMEDAQTAQEMTARLGDFLRMTLENVGTNEVTLRREIEFLECYLDIEKVRFGQRLATEIKIAPEVSSCSVPNLILQPLVENSIRHGLSKQIGAGRIRISAERENGWLKLEVADNGRGIEGGKLSKVLASGIGLSNTKARLEQLYGANFRFDLQNVETGGLLIVLRLPYNDKIGEEHSF